MARSATMNKKRLAIIFYVALFVMACLVLRLGYWMFIRGGELQEKAQNQQMKRIVVSAARGTIYDRNGTVLAKSASADTVVLRPKEIVDAGEVANLLAPILEMDSQKIYEKASDTSKFEIWLKRQITEEQSQAIEALNLKGVAFVTDTKRYYPNNAFLTQTLGFTTVDGVGLEGIEKKYDKYLAGTTGKILAESDGKSRLVTDEKEIYVEPIDGCSLYLTVDSVIQSYLEKACEDALEANQAQGVWGIAMDPNTGAILALTAQPDYDLNNRPTEAQVLQELSRNKIVVDAYEPGSTFKIITGASALDSGAITMDSKFNCSGYKLVNGQKIKCWRSYNPHGSQNIYQAFGNSCNPCFMEMALSMGTEKFYEYIQKFGFGSATGVDFSSDGTGIVRNIKYVKDEDLARIGFGQSIAVTPLQLITAVSAVINGGELYQPYLVSKIVDAAGNVVSETMPTAKQRVISDETSANMRSILEYVVSDGGGSNAKIDGHRMGGKTGTAQKYNEDGSISEGTMGSFIGFAPADDPKYIILIIVDEPGVAVDFGSVVAAPFVKEVMENTLKYAGIDPTEEVESVVVPSVKGKRLSEAASELRAAGLNFEADGTGEVRSQTPGAGETVTKGTNVLLHMSEKATDNEFVKVPDLKDKTVSEAIGILNAEGLRISVLGSGKISSQNPKAGTEARSGTTITVKCE